METERFEESGFFVTGPVLSHDECDWVIGQLEGISFDLAGTRNLLRLPWCVELASRIRAHAKISAFLPATAVAVQCTLFEKSNHRNWLVPWHQDLTIPVRERVSHPDLTVWSAKEGGIYVQPPNSVLENLVASRLHIDDCNADNGPLRIVPGSHRFGRHDAESARTVRRANGEIKCRVTRGGVVLMRPLLLHASSNATGPGQRRVLHFLFGPQTLPCGLEWPVNN